MPIDLLTFTLIFIPLALIIGIASGAIGYTAWAIVVPLAFVIFGFELYEALYISVFIDLIDSLYLTYIYHKKGQLDFKFSFKWMSVAIIGAIIGFILSEKFLASNQEILKGSVGWLVIAMGLSFVLKGNKMRKQMKNQELKIVNAPEPELIDSVEDSLAPQIQKPKFEYRFSPRISMLILFAGIFISGGAAGLLGMGSGMNFVLIFLLAINWDLRKATGTGIFFMFVMMVFCSIVYIPHVDFGLLWPYMIVSAGFSLVGTIVGSNYAFKLPKDKLNIMVGSVMILAATVATVQNFLV